VNSLFIQPISLRAVSLYSDPTGAAWELPCRVARLTQKDVLCLAPLVPSCLRKKKSPVDSASSQPKACFVKGPNSGNRLALVGPINNPLAQSAGPSSPVRQSWVSEIATRSILPGASDSGDDLIVTSSSRVLDPELVMVR
jgi:hypothetical protein